ncbi:hypothetical protein D3C71_1772070 [compost metagenome]
MTKSQRKFVEKTIGWAGQAALAAWAALILWGVVRVLIGALALKTFFSGMFSVDDAALVLWPLLGFGLVCFWIRTYMRAGEA